MTITAKSAVTVLGAGSYGTALAICLARNGHPIRLWGRDASAINELESSRTNERYLPGVTFPESLSLRSELSNDM